MMSLTGVIIGVFGGPIVDIIDNAFRSMGWFQYPAWGDYAGYDAAINIFYSFAYIIPLLGLFILFSTIFHRYGRDRSQPEEDEEIYLIDGGRI